MKIFETLKSDGNRAVKLFGITIYKKNIIDFINNSSIKTKRSQSLLNGLININKININFGYHIEKKIIILGKTFFTRIEDGDVKTSYCFGKVIKQESSKENFVNKYLKIFDNKYDDIYILNANSGEIYLFLTYFFDSYLKKNDSMAPLLVATKKYHLELVKMICPEVPIIFIDKRFINLKENQYNINNFRFFNIFCDYYFRKVEFDIKNNPLGISHYCDSIKSYIGLTDSDITMRKASVPAESEKSMLDKISSINLNLDNFVFIAPEAQSCELLPEQFLIDLINKYHKSNVDIFINLVGNCYNLSGVEYKSCFLTYSEVFALAQKSKKIISLRSGLTEFLLQTNVPIDILYTNFRLRPIFKDMSVEKVMSGFSIRKLFNVNQKLVNEYNFQDYARQDLINEITKDIGGNKIAV